MESISNREKIALKVSVYSIIANVILSTGKFAAGFIGNSAAMISDAVHSASDVFSTFIVIAGVKISGRASDNKHQYGHERLECVASIVLSVLLLLTGLCIGYDGYQKIYSDSPLPEPGGVALWAAVISIIVKEAMFWLTKKAAREINSDALMADAWHHRSDALSSIGSFIGIGGARMGYPILDPIASIVICLMIIYTACEIFKDSINKMIDHSCSSETVEQMRSLIEKEIGVAHIDSLHTRVFGSRIFVDVEVSCDDNLTLLESHRIAENIHQTIETNFTQVKHCMVHINPVSEIDHDF